MDSMAGVMGDFVIMAQLPSKMPIDKRLISA